MQKLFPCQLIHFHDLWGSSVMFLTSSLKQKFNYFIFWFAPIILWEISVVLRYETGLLLFIMSSSVFCLCFVKCLSLAS